MKKKEIICFVAGKSGGHIIPCLSIIQNNEFHNTKNILFFSSNTSLDKTILPNNQMVQWHITLPLNSRKESPLLLIWHSLCSFIISFIYLLKHRPRMTITTGGIVAIPTCLASFILRIPITIYSLDAIPGKAIQFLTPLATSINICFASSQRYFPAHKCSFAPYPLKYDSAENNLNFFYVHESLQLHPDKKTIAILGGSQGSLFLNEWTKKWATNSSFPRDKIQIIHQTGSIDTTEWDVLYKKADVSAHVFSYKSDLASVYMAADLIICRAGAGTLFEVKFFNKPCIIIPLTTATTTHQVDNAYAMSREYPTLFTTIIQNDITKNPDILVNIVRQFLQV